MPSELRPMKAIAGELPRDDEDGWGFEIKWDGMRAITFISPGVLRLQSSNLIDITKRFPELAPVAEHLDGHDVILDGEIVAFDDEGRPSFGRLQGRMHIASAAEARDRSRTTPASYVLFDLLHLDGNDTMSLPYADRRRLLEDLIEPGACWQVPSYRRGDGQALLDAADARGLEGVVAKRLDSRYEPGRRSPAWRKTKVRRRQEFVVGGWHGGEGGRAGRIGSLLLGYFEDGGLRYAGKVGTGFTSAELTRLDGVLRPLARDSSPFDEPPPRVVARVAHWVEPVVVAEVEYGEWTSDGVLRHPSYLGQRVDKDAREVTKDP